MPVTASYTLKLEGLDDKVSIEAATKLLKAIDGVDAVSIDAETNIATITLKAGKTLGEDALKAAFKDTKYTFKEFAKAE
ncbi:MAG: cation transporter [Planctomycetes bacterium]|nr:cation transporter [Planctomycetota bacterium]